ncbi:MAG TPA: MFS transporter [Propionicimonas sp.]|nr:MFS transporter [Propionicimonas sp.]
MTNTTTKPAPDRKSEGMVGAAVGTALEWFDWGIYGTFLPFFSTQFFNPKDAFAANLSAWLIFAVGFLARPLGGIIFGQIADTRGRKASMVLTSAAAGIGALLIAIAPTYAQIGIGAALLLTLARLVQGFAHGGEQPSAGAFISEVSKPHNRGAWASIIYVFGNTGSAIGILLAALLTSVLGNADMGGWGWRVAFAIGAVGSFGAMLYRMRMKETELFTNQAKTAEKPKLWAEIWKARKKAFQIIGMVLGMTVAFYLATTVLSAYHVNVLGAKLYGYNPSSGAAGPLGVSKTAYASQVSWVSFGVLVVYIITLPLWGWLSDKIGRKPILWKSTVGVAVAAVPLLTWINGEIWRLAVAMGLLLVLMGGASAIFPAVMAEIVPTRIRTLGVALPYALSTAIFGGTAPYLQQWMSGTWGPASFGWYVVALMIISTLVVASIPETKGIDLRDVK